MALMPAKDLYAVTMAAKRDYVLNQIRTSARNCEFKTELREMYMYKELEDKLKADGYIIMRSRSNWVTISWEHPNPAVNPNQLSS